MTTVDVYIRKADGSDSFSLHTGLFGPARQFWCPAKLLDVVLPDYEEWLLRQEGSD